MNSIIIAHLRRFVIYYKDIDFNITYSKILKLQSYMCLHNISRFANRLLIILSCLYSGIIFGKSENHLDSLMTIHLQSSSEEEKVESLIKIGSFYETKMINIDSSFYYFERALDLSNKLGDEKLIMSANMHMGLAHYDKGQYEEAMNKFNTGYDLAVAQEDSISQMRILNNKGLVLDVTGDFSQALDIYKKLMQIGLDTNHEKVICIASVNLSMVMNSLKRWEEGLEASENAIRYNKKYGDNFGLSVAYNNLSICQRQLGEYEASIEAIKLANVFANQSNNDAQKARFYTNIAATLIKMEQPDSALYYANEGIKFSSEINNKYQLLKNYWNQGEAFLELGKFQKAQQSSDKAMELSRETNTVEDILFNHNLSLQIAIAANESEKANALLDSVHFWKDKIFSENLSQDLAESEAKLKNEKLKNELLIKENAIIEEKKKKNFIIYSAVGILGAIFISTFAFVLWLENRNKKEKLRIEQSFNRELINEIDQYRKRVSHTLHDDLGQGIFQIKQALKDKSKTDEVYASIDNLSDHIRTLSRAQYPYQIEYVGFENALSELFENVEESTDIGISDDFMIGKQMVNSFQATHLFYVIQELISNSLKHSNATKVSVSIKEVGSYIQLKYLENGDFFNFKEQLRKTKHLGLKLIQHRIRILEGNVLYAHNNEGLNEFTIAIPKNFDTNSND